MEIQVQKNGHWIENFEFIACLSECQWAWLYSMCVRCTTIHWSAVAIDSDGRKEPHNGNMFCILHFSSDITIIYYDLLQESERNTRLSKYFGEVKM